ncbi:DNA polymerase iota-like [Antedon mediterranea]|uniref:DNA polymerase iota-like n=1 Tax=Antedon mediterranea TaxID=105859 RepID=UPI003AF4C24D
MDCFYAQVEMILNPTLGDKPLGIQQKNIVVTCNYVAREQGVGKLSYVKDALKICPKLVLVSGEDLTKYREMSYKVTDYLLQFCPLVERLGFDENFIDVTNLVKDRQASNKTYDVKGHSYFEDKVPRMHCSCGCYERLAIGSHIASEMRAGLKESLGLTSCAGISHNKLLSKLVAGTHKPNQQTVLFPHQVDTLLLSLKSVQQIPGIGSSMSKRLAAMGIVSIQQLRTENLNSLQLEFGIQVATTIHNLSHGRDPSPVTQTGPPQSLSDEDSFIKCNSVEDARNRTREILRNLLQRLREDGRVPHTLRIAVRKFSKPKQWTRESRQCPFPDGVLQDSDSDKVIEKILDVAMNLFSKLVEISKPFHLTLISVCFTKLEDRSKKPSITTYFKKSTDGPAANQKIDILKTRSKKPSIDTYFKKPMQQHDPGKHSRTFEIKDIQKVNSFFQKTEENTMKKQKVNHSSSDNSSKISENRKLISELFSGQSISSKEQIVDNSILDLEYNSKKAILDDKEIKYVDTSKTSECPSSSKFENKDQVQHTARPTKMEDETNNSLDLESTPSDFNNDLPPNVDVSVFSQLPTSVQKELIENWKREKTKLQVKPRSKEVKKSIKEFFTTK